MGYVSMGWTRCSKRVKMCRMLLGAAGLFPGSHKTLLIRRLILGFRKCKSTPRIPIGTWCGMTSCNAGSSDIDQNRDPLLPSRVNAPSLSDVLFRGRVVAKATWSPKARASGRHTNTEVG